MRQSDLGRVNPNEEARRRKAREMERIDRAVYEMVMRQGLRTKALGTADVRGISAGRPEEGAERPATAQQREEENRAPMGMSLKRGRVGARPSLKLIIGGKS